MDFLKYLRVVIQLNVPLSQGEVGWGGVGGRWGWGERVERGWSGGGLIQRWRIHFKCWWFQIIQCLGIPGDARRCSEMLRDAYEGFWFHLIWRNSWVVGWEFLEYFSGFFERLRDSLGFILRFLGDSWGILSCRFFWEPFGILLDSLRFLGFFRDSWDSFGILADSFGILGDSFGILADSFGILADSFGILEGSFGILEDFLGIHLGFFRDSFGILSGFFRDSFGILLGFFRDSFGILVDSFGSLSGFFWILWNALRFLGFFRDSFGILLGFFRDSFGILLCFCWRFFRDCRGLLSGILEDSRPILWDVSGFSDMRRCHDVAFRGFSGMLQHRSKVIQGSQRVGDREESGGWGQGGPGILRDP